MRTELYIGGMPVDMGDTAILQFNYSKDDLDNPTAVKNAWTQQVTLPGTPANNRLFGCFGRSDRNTLREDGKQTGPWFDPMRQTPFVLYRDDGTIAESGYAKLEGVQRKGVEVTYTVTLYGGLGSFIYALTYNEEGDRLSLADLDFLGTGDPASELDFTIDADAVRAAWARLAGDSSKPAMWDVLTFVPAYNGIPDGEFSADKAVCVPADCGLPTQSGDYGVPEGGKVLVSLPQEFTEWQTKDLRSYLQRPAVSVRSIVEACCRPENNGGYEVELDPAFFNDGNPYWSKAWMTLPMLPEAELEIRKYSGNGSGTVSPINARTVVVTSPTPRRESGQWVMDFSFTPSLAGISLSGDLVMHSYYTGGGATVWSLNYFRITVSGLSASNRVMASASGTIGTFSQAGIITPVVTGYFNGSGVWQGQPLTLSLPGQDFVNYRVTVEVLQSSFDASGQHPEVPLLTVWDKTDNPNIIAPSHSISSYTQAYAYTYSFESPDRVRSGVALTKADLLNTGSTPADYLLGFCKMFGLCLLRDREAKKVSILARPTFYNGPTEDITERVDLSEASVVPTAASSRWYEFSAAAGDGRYAEWYRQKYGREYGLMRVNSGWEFDSDTKDVTDGIVYAGGVTVQESSPCFCGITSGDTSIPPVFVYPGATYDLVDADGNSEEQDVPAVPSDAVTEWYGDTMQLDLFPKMQFRDTDNKAVDGSGVPVFFCGMAAAPSSPEGYALTDDTADMMLLNDNTPCWLLNAQVSDNSLAVMSLPQFGRVLPEQAPLLMDYGVPAEFAFPLEYADQSRGIYELYWRRFFADRYETDTRVLTCRVDLRGYDVWEDLLRRFWVFDDTVWVMNRIEDYTPDTAAQTTCEFVRVQDSDNYKA